MPPGPHATKPAAGALWYEDAPPANPYDGRCLQSGFSNPRMSWNQNDVMSALYIYPVKPGCL